VDKLEYTANVQFPAQDPSKYYEPEEFNCFCFDYDPKPQNGRLNVEEEWTVFNLDPNTTVLKDLSKSIRIVNKVNSSGPVTIMQLGHKAGFWNVSWGQAERWKDPYYTSCPYPASCLSTSDAETFYGDGRRGQAFRFGMNGSPAWHKYDLNTNKGTFYSSVGERSPSEYNGTDLLTILTHSTPNRTNPKLLFDEIDAHEPDEKIFRYEMEMFVEKDPALQKLMPSKEDQENLIKDLFERYDGNSDDIIKLHMEWLSRSCTPTTTGPMCASCKTGYYRQSKDDANCEKCTTSKTTMAMVLFFSSIAALSICGYLLHRRMKGNRQKKIVEPCHRALE
jgi:hypothetical protein